MFMQVLKGLLVFGTAERITLPLELFAMTIGLVYVNRPYWVTLGRADMPVEVYFGWDIRVCCRSVVFCV